MLQAVVLLIQICWRRLVTRSIQIKAQNLQLIVFTIIMDQCLIKSITTSSQGVSRVFLGARFPYCFNIWIHQWQIMLHQNFLQWVQSQSQQNQLEIVSCNFSTPQCPSNLQNHLIVCWIKDSGRQIFHIVGWFGTVPSINIIFILVISCIGNQTGLFCTSVSRGAFCTWWLRIFCIDTLCWIGIYLWLLSREYKLDIILLYSVQILDYSFYVQRVS